MWKDNIFYSCVLCAISIISSALVAHCGVVWIAILAGLVIANAVMVYEEKKSKTPWQSLWIKEGLIVLGSLFGFVALLI